MKFKVLQWNCMYSENVENICKFIGELQPDIFCLQELTNGYHAKHKNTGEYIVDILKCFGHHSYGSMILPDASQAMVGMGIFSKYPMVNNKKIILQEGITKNGKILQDERFYLQSIIKLGEYQLTVGTTHLPFHPRFRTTLIKQEMAEDIIKNIPKGVRYILAGDLNTTPRTKVAKALRQSGLVNAGPALTQPTWTTKPFTVGPWRYESLNWRLDYVLYSGSINRLSCKILDTELSDHLPILSEFEIIM